MVQIFNRISKALRKATGTYDSTSLSADDIAQASYKKLLGGGEIAWDARGAFQLYFLKLMGLEPSHSLLDAGCGPVRGGAHFIRYLNPRKYCGIDYNSHFIDAAKSLVVLDDSLSSKEPRLEHIEHFKFSKLEESFDFVFSFSVLNHAPENERKRYFLELPDVLNSGSKIYITHATWFRGFPKDARHLRVTRQFLGPADIEVGLDMQNWGWTNDESIYPILELMAQ